MIPTASPETQPVRPSRAAAIAAPLPQAQPARLPSAALAPSPGGPDPDLRSASGLAPSLAVRSSAEPHTTETPESRRANVRAHVTRRLTALQAMDAAMQAALMRIAQMRQLALRSGKGGHSEAAPGHPGADVAHGLAEPPPEATLSSVFADLEKDIEQLVAGQLGGYLSTFDQAPGDEAVRADSKPLANARTPRGARTRSRDDARSARSARRDEAQGARPSQRVQLQVASGTAEVSTGPLSVSGEVASEEGATALLADLDLLAQQIAGARASIQTAVNRLQRDANQTEPPPVRTLGGRRRQAAEGNAQPEPVKPRKTRPEDPIAVVRARLAMAIASQANTSPEAAMRLL